MDDSFDMAKFWVNIFDLFEKPKYCEETLAWWKL